MRYVLLLFTISFLASCYSSQDLNSRRINPKGPPGPHVSDGAMPPMPMEPGKCYAKSKTLGSYVQKIDTLGVFAKDEAIPEDLLKEVETVPASEKWEKKKADRNCLAADPEDCLVWCLVKQDAEYASPHIKTDSMSGNKFVILDARYRNQVDSQLVWKEVLCDGDKRSKGLILDVQLALLARGYDVGQANSQLTSKTKEMLTKFQQDNGLEYGQFDIDTLRALGVIN